MRYNFINISVLPIFHGSESLWVKKISSFRSPIEKCSTRRNQDFDFLFRPTNQNAAWLIKIGQITAHHHLQLWLARLTATCLGFPTPQVVSAAKAGDLSLAEEEGEETEGVQSARGALTDGRLCLDVRCLELSPRIPSSIRGSEEPNWLLWTTTMHLVFVHHHPINLCRHQWIQVKVKVAYIFVPAQTFGGLSLFFSRIWIIA